MVTLEALAYLARCQPQEGHGYRPVERVYLLQVGAAAGGTAGSVGGAFGKNFFILRLLSIPFSLYPFISEPFFSLSLFLL